ncbi:helix-turn-helix domain-containing protein [Paraliobacillus sp. X-1268]|uniref:helix-turn-helix domain-containing protein n=1 Tax=Paraliobacillus sp. X-1268 TaxID=2213193 RepID=UPI000E3EA1F5|nr:helix-turn-helix domain-containing protein [Paraliobacillus sp. X-1268]
MDKEINNYMTPAEAAYRWGKNQETVKNKLKPSLNSELDQMIKRGLIKYYQKPDGQRREWIVSVQAMEEWFGKIN